MHTVLITGGTGLVGKALLEQLIKKGYKVIILTRKIADKKDGVEYALWDIKKKQIDITAIQKSDYIIHLAGAGVMDKKWSTSYKEEILRSRTESSRLLADTLKHHSNSVKAIVSASAIGWYGEDKDGHPFTEKDPPDKGFLGETCRLWELSIEAAEEKGVRVARLRTGIVLSNDGGALKEFKKPINVGIAGIVGSGQQVVSWIHISDLCRMYIYALENKGIRGSYNAVAPLPITNKQLTLKLAESIKGKFYIPLHVPKFIIRLMLGQRSIEVLKSITVSPKKIKDTGFTFLFPSLNAALKDLFNQNAR